MKKTLLFTLLFTLVLTLTLTACGKSGKETTKNTESETTVPITTTTTGTESTDTAVDTTGETPITKNPSLETAYNNPEQYVSLPDFSTIEISNGPINTDVNNYLAQVLEALGKEDYKTLDKSAAAILGDMVNIYYTGTPKDSSLEISEETMQGMSNASNAVGYDLVLGSGSFIDGFEEQLIGAKTGEKVIVCVTFPEEYHSEELCGVEVLFEVTVNSVSRATAGENHELILYVTYEMTGEEATSELATFMEGHEIAFDMRDASALFDDYFSAELFRTQILGKSTFRTLTLDLTMPLDSAKEFGYDHEITLKATITLKQIILYPEEITDEDINSYTGGSYTTAAAFVEYITNYYKSSYAFEAISNKAVIAVNQDVYAFLYQYYYDIKIESLIGDMSEMTEEELAKALTDEVKSTADTFAKENATAEYNDRMLLAYLAKKVNFTLTEELYQQELAAMFEYYMQYYYYQMLLSGITTVEAFENHFGRDALELEFISSYVVEKLPPLVTFVD